MIADFGFCDVPRFSVFKCINDTNKNEVTLCTNQDITFDANEFILTYKGSNYKVFASQKTPFPFKGEGFTNIQIPSEFTVLRRLVYKQIKKELPTAFEHLSL
ncbi:MAG: hypothetical protein A2Z60_00935 [Nitrospirae bacterium RIFCSPLOWO2_02_42_7]|nr:MAG: hypothetical protein A2Z60_00935 [Nitrospirae bacterium RIFCSPLOWO2_02_42_7]